MRWEVSYGVATAVAISAYVLPYRFLPGVWWRAIPSTCVILLVGVLLHGRAAPQFFGLRVPARQLAGSVVLFWVLLALFSHVVFSYVVVKPLSAERHASIAAQTHQFFQVFNDEIVVRAALLTLLLRVFPRPRVAILGTALVFALGHHFLYGLNGIAIDWQALVTVFSFGAIANCWFVRYRHIGYGLALHYAWNFDRFSTAYYLHGSRLSEGATFNYIEGNACVAAAAFATFGVVFYRYWMFERSTQSGT